MAAASKNIELLWLAYLSGQYGRETLNWHKSNTPGFAQHVRERIAEVKSQPKTKGT